MAGTSNDAVDLSESSDSFELEDSFVAPWGLAVETRPMHLLWNGEIERVEVRFVEPVELIEAYNLDDEVHTYAKTETYDDGTDVRTVSISHEDLETPGYLSIKFSIPVMYEDAMVGQKVEVTFHLPDEEIILDAFTFTIRPQIECVESPETVIVEDDEDLDEINIKMRYIGFGLAQVRIEAEAEGELISEGESIYHDIAAALFESGFHEKETDQLEPVPEDWKEDAGVEIPREVLEDIVQGVRETLTEGSAFDEFDMEELQQLADILEEGEEDIEISPVYQHVEILLLNSILDVVERHPIENVQLADPYTKVEIESRMHGFIIRYRLEDNQGNEFDPVEVPISVEDKRETGRAIETEINTEWEHHQLDPDEVLAEIMEEI